MLYKDCMLMETECDRDWFEKTQKVKIACEI